MKNAELSLKRTPLFRRARWMAAAFGLIGVLLASLSAGAPAAAKTFVIGGKAFTEQRVLAEITRQLLEREGIEVRVRTGYATDQIRKAQLAGEVDISWDYTWTGYNFHQGMTEPVGPDEALRIVREMDQNVGLVWLDRSSVNNTYGFAVNLDFAAENCIHSVADLAAAIRNGLKIRLASDQEFHKREDGLLAMQKAYDFTIPVEQISVMNVAATHDELRARKVDVAVVYTTDGKIPAYDLELLEDPQSTFAEYYLVAVARQDALRADPRIKPILDRITQSIDTATMQDLHYRVDVIGQPIPAVATYFIRKRGL